MPVVGNRIKVASSSTGTGNITLGSAEDGFQTFADGGISNNDVVRYVITEGSSFEIGKGTYLTSGPTLTRTSGNLLESSTGSLLNLGGSATVFVSLADVDVLQTDGGTMTGALSISQATASTASLSVTNSGGQYNNSLIASFIGDSDAIQIRNDATGDYKIINSQQGNGISIYDGTGGVKLRYNGSDIAGCDSSGGFEVTSGNLSVTNNMTVGGTITASDDITISSSGLTGTPCLRINNSATGNNFPKAIEAYNSGISTGQRHQIMLGKDGSTYDTASLSFYYAGNASSSNRFEVGFWSAGSLFVVRADGNVGVGTDAPSQKLDVSGNIAVSGTVDGRDVATDGTKLDGIEASADVTDATNVAAAGAAMTSGATFTGDVTFDGATAGRDIVFDRSDNALEFADNAILKFGQSADLQIFHDASNSYVQANVSGNLYLRNATDNFDVIIEADNGSGGLSTYIQADGSTGEAKLFFYGSEKLSTKTGGVDVTGTVTATAFSGDGSSLTGISASAEDGIFWENDQAVTSNYTITNNKNAMSAGPITINSGVTVTVGDGEAWTVV